MWHQHFPFSAVHLVSKIWMQRQQNCIPLLAAHLLSSYWLLALAWWYLVISFPHDCLAALMWATVGDCFKFIILPLPGKKKKKNSVSLAASVLRFFSCGCPDWGTCSSPLYRNEKHRGLCAWDRCGTLPIVLLNSGAERQLCAPSSRHGPCTAQDPVGEGRLGKEQPDMYEAVLFHPLVDCIKESRCFGRWLSFLAEMIINEKERDKQQEEKGVGDYGHTAEKVRAPEMWVFSNVVSLGRM